MRRICVYIRYADFSGFFWREENAKSNTVRANTIGPPQFDSCLIQICENNSTICENCYDTVIIRLRLNMCVLATINHRMNNLM